MERYRLRRSMCLVSCLSVLVAGMLSTASASAATHDDAAADAGVQANPGVGLDRIDQRKGRNGAYRYQTLASQVTVYVIDSGIDRKHPDFGGRVQAGKDFVDKDDDATDVNGHGTHIAGVVGGNTFGVAKGVQLVPIRVLDADGGGSTENIIAGIEWVTKNARQPAVALLGIAGAANNQLDNAVQKLAATMPVALPAGGATVDVTGVSPARVSGALTVGAVDTQDRLFKDSNVGALIDLFAPAVDIPSAAKGGNGSQLLSGTSVAAAHVAGVAALYRSVYPQDSVAKLNEKLLDNATKNALSGLPEGTSDRLVYSLVK